MDKHKSGFVTIIGRPNVGKSTFVNRVIGHKIAIMSDKAQTTRNKIQGVMTQQGAQIVFLDTPGIHKPKHKLGQYMMKVAKNTLSEIDAVMFMVNVNEPIGRGDEYIMDMLKTIQTPVFLVLNKIDLVHPDQLMPRIEQYQKYMDFAEIVPISALEGHNVDHFINVLKSYLPEGPQYYPDGQISDHPEQFVVSELIREKILQTTSEEIPHAIGVHVEQMIQESEDRVHIEAIIFVERDSQKGIVIGKGGKKLKEIGKRARRDIEHLLGSKVYLDLWVKVQKDWRNKATFIKQMGYVEDE